MKNPEYATAFRVKRKTILLRLQRDAYHAYVENYRKINGRRGANVW